MKPVNEKVHSQIYWQVYGPVRRQVSAQVYWQVRSQVDEQAKEDLL